MWSIVEYLKSPELVVRIQEWFGVKYEKPSEVLNSNANTKLVNNGISNGAALQNGNGFMHKRNISNESNTSSETDEGTNVASVKPYVITNRFWYYLFVLGTEMGDEIFYATIIPFWLWNIDGAVGRRVVFVWSIVMYIGQSLKDIIRWPRPGRPVYQLQQKWGLEYGMPSTHAMVAVSMPFSVVLFMIDRYQFNVSFGLIVATVWCTVICLSRLYLGMHSVLDIIAGLSLTITLLIPLIPLVDALDYIILTSRFSPIFLLFISIIVIVYYPRSDKWTPTRGDTTMTTSVTAGIYIGAWINYQFGYMQSTTMQRPYAIIWPTHGMLGLILLRTVLGLCCVVAARAIAKSLSYAFVCILLGKDKNELRNSENSLENRDKTIVELCYKYFTFGMIGVTIQYLLPNVFKMLDIGRPDFYTEI